ncbi:12848_t:CDS:2, partial [Entrophospora sp. SA101]
MRSLIDRWCQSTKYVAEIHKQDLLFYHIIDKIESSATAPQSVFKDRWTDLINVMEDIFTPSNIDPNEKQDVKIYIKELMKKVVRGLFDNEHIELNWGETTLKASAFLKNKSLRDDSHHGNG